MRCRRLIFLGWLAAPARGSCGDFTRIVVGDVDTATDAFAIDLDGDGAVDVVSTSDYDRTDTDIGTVYWHANDGSGSPGFGVPIVVASGSGSDPQNVFALDVDGDGDVDALSADQSTIAWHENDGSQSFAERIITTLADGAHTVYAIDVDGDGDVDALCANYNGYDVEWYENDGSQSFTEHVIADSGGMVRSVFAIDVGHPDGGGAALHPGDVLLRLQGHLLGDGPRPPRHVLERRVPPRLHAPLREPVGAGADGVPEPGPGAQREAPPRAPREGARARVDVCVEIDHRFGTSRPNFEILSLGQFEVDSADFGTDRLLSLSYRSTAEELVSKHSNTRTLKSV